jgi:hypothetical protein
MPHESTNVLRENEILLYGQNFPITGTVRRTAVTPFAPKFVLGDYTREDKVVTSSWVISNFSGGFGILNGQLPQDIDRFADSTLLSLYKYLTLNTLIHPAGNLPDKAELLMEYADTLYAFVGTEVYKWTESTQSWGTNLHTISASANAGAIFNGSMFIITDLGLHSYNAITNTWTDFMSPDTYVPTGDSLIEWDGKLFRIGQDDSDSSLTRIYWTIDPDVDNNGASESTDWDEGGLLHLPRGYCQQLLIYFDLTGEPVIHAITRSGVYGYDFDSEKFYITPVTHPTMSVAGKGAMVWRGELYVPEGTEAIKYNGSTLQSVGPAKDEGLPSHLQGNILQMVPGHGFYYAVIATTTGSTIDTLSMPFFEDATPTTLDTVVLEEFPTIGVFPLGSSSSVGAIVQSPGLSWHPLFEQSIGGTMGYCLVTSLDNTFRLWITHSDGASYIDIDTGLHNPLQNPTTEFREDGYLETPWVDLGWAELDKLALSLDVDAEGIDAVLGTSIQVEIAYDGDESWETVALVTQNGLTQYAIGQEPGRVFRRVKFRIQMVRGSISTTATPVLRHMIFGFMRRPQLLWGWDINIQLSKRLHYGKTSEQLLERLYEIAEVEKIAGTFTYRDRRTGLMRSRRVVLSNIQGAELTGSEASARYTVSLIQLDELTNEQ